MMKTINIQNVIDYYELYPPYMKAHMVDWLIHSALIMNQTDESLVFSAMLLCDRYVSQLDIQHLRRLLDRQINDYQLTCISTLLIASKNSEILPLDIETSG
jgi:Cyclin, N-terminal domain